VAAEPVPDRRPEPGPAAGTPSAPEPAATEPAPPAAEPPAPTHAPAPVPAAAPAPAAVKGPGGIDTDALRRSWPDVLDWLGRNKRVTWTFVAQNAQVQEYDGQRVVLAISTTGLAETFRRGAHAEYVRQALIDVLGVDARVEGVPGDVAPPPEPAAAPVPSFEAPPPASDPAPVQDVGVAPAAPRSEAPSWSDAPPPPESAPSWASPLEQAKAAVAAEQEQEAVAPHVVDDTAISEDDESIEDLTDVGVPVVERILGGTVIHEEQR
ncbi:DNA polymerase III subunit gamma and tau, partial [Phycicoccus avicenniae]